MQLATGGPHLQRYLSFIVAVKIAEESIFIRISGLNPHSGLRQHNCAGWRLRPDETVPWSSLSVEASAAVAS
jgi:hypothetical protein